MLRKPILSGALSFTFPSATETASGLGVTWSGVSNGRARGFRPQFDGGVSCIALRAGERWKHRGCSQEIASFHALTLYQRRNAV